MWHGSKRTENNMQIEVDKLVGPVVYGNVELMLCIYLASFQPLSTVVAKKERH